MVEDIIDKDTADKVITITAMFPIIAMDIAPTKDAYWYMKGMEDFSGPNPKGEGADMDEGVEYEAKTDTNHTSHFFLFVGPLDVPFAVSNV